MKKFNPQGNFDGPALHSTRQSGEKGGDLSFDPSIDKMRGLLDEMRQRLERIQAENRTLRAAKTELETLQAAREKAEAALKISKAQKETILDASPDRIRFVDQDLRIKWVNRTMAEMLKTSPEALNGKTCHELLVNKARPCEGCPTVMARESGRMERSVMYKPRVVGVQGGSYWDVYSVPLKNEAGQVESFIQISRNITDQKRTMDALKESEAALKAILSASPVGIGLTRDRTLIWANKALYEMLGHEEGSGTGTHIKRVYLDAREYERVGRELDRAEKSGINHIETLWRRKDGSTFPCFLQTSHLEAKDPGKGLIVTVMDITERKKAEARVHHLTQELIKAQETERARIAYDLHDQLGQDLSSLKIVSETLFDEPSQVPPAVMVKVSGLSKRLRQAIASVRDLAYDLRPPGLEELGLVPTVFRYCEDFQEKTAIQVDFNAAGMENLDIEYEIEINLYRLIQEAFNNIRKHSQALGVTIRMVASSPQIILRIEDDGVGFDVEGCLQRSPQKKRMGLGSMQERVSLLNGELNIQSRPGQGTRISVKIPYKPSHPGEI